MSTLIDILSFRKMIAPAILRIMFWAGICGTLYGAWVLYTLDNWAWTMALFFGTLGTRVIFEGLMLAFQSYARLVEIRAALQARGG